MPDVQIVVEAGDQDREFCPVMAELDSKPNFVQLQSLETGGVIPAQVQRSSDGAATVIRWIVEDLKAGEQENYILLMDVPPGGKEGVSVNNVPDQKIEFHIDGELFTSYCFAKELSMPYLYPLIGPCGDPVTSRVAAPEDIEDEEMGHHRGIWVADGTDNWSEGEGHGKTVHTEFESIEEGPVFSRISAKSDWVSKDETKIMEERRVHTIYRLPQGFRAIDMELRFTAAEKDVCFGDTEDVRFGDTKEGGIASIRVVPSMEVRRGGKMQNSRGAINEKEMLGVEAEWCDYSGPVEGKTVGIAIFESPQSFRHPTRWHARDDGLLTTNPFGVGTFTGDLNKRGDYILKQGESIDFYYRFYIHKGDATEGKVAEKYRDFVNPPEVYVA